MHVYVFLSLVILNASSIFSFFFFLFAANLLFASRLSWSVVIWLSYWLNSVTILFLVLSATISAANGEHLLQKLSGSVGAGNFTYYNLNWPGRIRVKMIPLFGDSDLYVSDKTLKPTYYDNELCSATCGEESIDIPAAFKRPVIIGIYGYPLIEKSKYELCFYFLADYDDVDEYDAIAYYSENLLNPGSMNHDKMGRKNDYRREEYTPQPNTDGQISEEEESIIWTVFIYILKIIFDILL